MNTVTASDDVVDAIASIEMHRQESAKETGLAAACDEALRKLHELLGQEQEAFQRHGPGTLHPANVAALTAEIERVQRLAKAPGRVAMPGHERSQRQNPGRPGEPHNRPRGKGRRTMGRRGGR